METKLIELHKVMCKSLHCNYDEFQCAMTIDTLITAENLLANGVAIVVHCKDCAYFLDEYAGERIGMVKKCENFQFYTKENDFCSFGWMKNNEGKTD